VAADVLDLPFKDGAFDVALAGFLINHMPPGPALAELARVVGPGGVVLASTWATDGPDPVKAAIDTSHGVLGMVSPGLVPADEGRGAADLGLAPPASRICRTGGAWSTSPHRYAV
jgi:SAM-dependent methyltransferase